jgi:TolA-binding protein
VNEVDVYTQLTALDQRSSVSEHRIADLEDSQKQIYKLTSSVQELSFSIKSMTEEKARQSKELARQAERVRCIEERPTRTKRG